MMRPSRLEQHASPALGEPWDADSGITGQGRSSRME